ncbi:GntR family transcriptional regulator [Lentzea sp. NPDC051208]|uniref:FadR/GntR family transcriptional regulator n=1 Tax=Lentzea sp. NPDC051208 TaxID=3154642 RepID=UPI00343F05AE
MAEKILELISELELRPGDRMPTENELAARRGTSRTVVREAVKILSALGRVRAHKGRGLYVANDEGMLGASRWGGFFLPTDLDHVYVLFEFRRVQETAAARYAATRATPAELHTIETAAEMCRQDHLTGQAALFDQGDDDFHAAIAAASHNQFLVAAVREARRLQRQSNIIGLSGTVGSHTAEGRGARRALPGHPARRPRSRRRRGRRARGPDPRGLPPGDPAPRVRPTWTRLPDVCYNLSPLGVMCSTETADRPKPSHSPEHPVSCPVPARQETVH